MTSGCNRGRARCYSELDRRLRAKPQAALMDHLRKARDWVDTEGRFDDPKSKVKLLDTFAEAMAKLQAM